MLPTTVTGKHYRSLLPKNIIFLLWVNSYSSSSGSNNHDPLFLQREHAVLRPREKLIFTMHVQTASVSAQERGEQRTRRLAERKPRGTLQGSRSCNSITWQKLKKQFSTRMALKGLRLGSSPPRKGSYLVSSPSALCPGTCNSESESVHVDVCRGRWCLGIQRPELCFMRCHLISVS